MNNNLGKVTNINKNIVSKLCDDYRTFINHYYYYKKKKKREILKKNKIKIN